MSGNMFGQILKDLRKEKNLNQVSLAKALNVSKGVISLWENGLREPGMNSLIIIAKFFNVSIDYLTGLEKY